MNDHLKTSLLEGPSGILYMHPLMLLFLPNLLHIHNRLLTYSTTPRREHSSVIQSSLYSQYDHHTLQEDQGLH